MLQIILTLAIFVILVIPMGKYMYHIATKQKTFADKVFNPIDRCIYKVCGIKGEDMGWKKYALTLLLVNAVMVFVGYAILRLQSILFLNPNGISNMEPTLSFNTIISFMTNAFQEDSYLPQEILWREKAAFSDAVGHSMVDYLKEYAESVYTDQEMETLSEKYTYARPFTKESLLYREIFEKYYPGQAEMIAGFWMPNKEWEGCDVNDPSARVLSNYGESGK